MKFTNTYRLIPMLLLLFAMAGCGSSNTAVAPSEKVDSDSVVLDSHYQLILDQDAGTCELVNRNAEFDITENFAVRLQGYEWDPVKRLLYARVELENLVRTIYYGVRLVFDNTGGRWIVNSDGYDDYKIAPDGPPTKLMPYITYKRDTYHREFPGPQSALREICIYCPPGAGTIDFWVDGVQQWEREEPIVEEQFCHKTLAISAWAVTAFCYDFQSHFDRSPYDGINDIEVWADLSGIGGPSKADMFDDGMHWDYEEGDYIYGIDFVPDPMVDFAMIPIYCEDSDGYVSQNKVAFIRHYTLRDFQIDTIEQGFWSELMGPHYEIIRDDVRWEEFWIEHKDAPIPPPYVDFSRYMVLVAIVGMGGGGESIEIKNAFINTKNKLEIQASTWNGTKGCILPSLLTNSYHIATIQKDSHYPDPKLRERLFYCDEQIPFNIVVSGDFSEIHEFRQVLVEDWQTWVALWNEHTGGATEPPFIDFEIDTVAAVFLGDRELDDTYVDFDRIMEYQAPSREIYWSEHYPGYGCELAPLDCQPYSIIVFSKAEHFSYEFFSRRVPDDCV